MSINPRILDILGYGVYHRYMAGNPPRKLAGDVPWRLLDEVGGG